MKKLARRLIAGVSAAALFVSAVGGDAFTNVFMNTASADASTMGKNGRSTGFPNLEQDTDKDGYYNTGYGLHTNKTATEVTNAAGESDGRTFDVNLESWYVGENPVDVATILDASGSMAWTVDTLDPMKVNDQLDAADRVYLMTKYDTEDLAQIQEAKGGYLPQDVVDLILDPKKTDNTKLSYAGYMYYVYEDRSSVSEFVPLGYWDGGKIKTVNDLNPIGYYSFESSLENKAHGKNGSATYIAHAEDTVDGVFDEKNPAVLPIVSFSGGYLDLSETDKNGNLVFDLSEKLDVNNEITISFTLKCDQLGGTGNEQLVPQSPILYLGDGSNGNCITLMRGRAHTGTGASNHIYVYDSKKNQLQAYMSDGVTTSDNNNNKFISNTGYGKDIKCTLKISVDTGSDRYKIELSSEKDTFIYYTENLTKLNSNSLYLVLGGDEILYKGEPVYNDKTISTDNLKGNKIKNLTIAGTATDNSPFSASFGLDNAMSLKDATTGITADYYKQLETGSTQLDFVNEPVTTEQSVSYSSEKFNGSYSLNVTETSKFGSVLLDAHPTGNSYTLAFAIKKAKDSEDDSTELSKDKNIVNNPAEIMYIGDSDISSEDYYAIRRNTINDNRHLRLCKGEKTSSDADINGVFQSNTVWSYITYVFDNRKLRVYKDGVEAPSTKEDHPPIEELEFESLGIDTINFIIAGLKEEYSGSDILIDDLYVFDQALTKEDVQLVYNDRAHKQSEATAEECGQYHALSVDGVEVAQINKSLANNTKVEDRRGWYYVNSHSTWADIEGCLESGKQYIGIYDRKEDGKNNGIESVVKAGRDIATIPSAYNDTTNDEYAKIKESIKKGDTGKETDTNENKKFRESPEHERSIRFYVDSQGHLRCFAWSGNTSKNDDPATTPENEEAIYTFCSLVYVKDTDNNQITKYEALNEALNEFYSKLAKDSELSNSAIVRFSTNKLVDEGKADENLKMLIMKGWTNWSDYYQKCKEDDPDKDPSKASYLQDLLKAGDKTSTGATPSLHEIDEYPYVMTGGTFTWTGLKSFYDNLVNKDATGATQITKDIANDARDKYLIIFTDGRDNTQDLNTADNGKLYNDTDYCNVYSPEGFPAEEDGLLAEAWAKKLKVEGYTIYCVMMAAGSISPTANPTEYEKAKTFVTSLAGSKETTLEAAKDYVTVIGSGAGEGAVDSVKDAFDKILTQIQQPRDDYTVQDYIDPRFDLIGKDSDGNEVIYHLGAGGEVTFTDTNNTKLSQIQVDVPDGTKATLKSGDKANNIIDNIDKTDIVGLAYTPQSSYMVNRKADSTADGGYTTGDEGTGYLYYDDVKDMYYLRWTEQIIPMENESFTTGQEPNEDKKLDVWSATIRLKAKDDFIGGNNILTNGNEAGENLVYSDATIKNMDKNPELYFTADELEKYTDSDDKIDVPYRKKLERLSGTDRKINAVDAGGVSQAVYGNGIDIPSSGFPRTTVNVRLLKLDAKNLNDVIYMGEVISPTMMLADLENGYMTGSYYLEYLERYAYRVYGNEADNKPLLDLLNEWLKINNEKETEKTFTIPYMYLPDPVYKGDVLETDPITDRVEVSNSSGASWNEDKTLDFTDPNLRDVTGFITYTWKRDDGNHEEQQKTGETNASGDALYDITREYVVKNTEQIKYNLELKFTPLQKDELKGFTLENEKFIVNGTGDPIDRFFRIDTESDPSADTYFEFTAKDSSDKDLIKWEFTNRSDYLKAIVQEVKSYQPHVVYDATAESNKGKWVLVDSSSHTIDAALEFYTEDDDQAIPNSDGKTLTDKGVYDWDSEYKPVAGSSQIEGNNLTKYYTETPYNVSLADKDGNSITDKTGKFMSGKSAADVYSLTANTTYVKDVVNGALALELCVRGKYLKQTDSPFKENQPFTFEATRYYDDPNDPLRYGSSDGMKADTETTGTKYQLTFAIDGKTLPKVSELNDDEIYTIWAKLTQVAVENGSGGYQSISTKPTTDEKTYIGYKAPDALPIGTYVIDTTENPLNSFKIGTDETGAPVYFKYLKIDNSASNYKYKKFPENVYNVSGTAVESTGDDEYLIRNGAKDYSPENIADNKRNVETVPDTQTVKFYFGTVEDTNAKGVSVKDYLKENPEDTTAEKFTEDYAKDRLGILLLAADNNMLTISKEVTNTNDHNNDEWEFKITIKTSDTEWIDSKDGNLSYTLYTHNRTSGKWEPSAGEMNIPFTSDGPDSVSGIYTLTATLQLKHDQKAVFKDLPEGTWKVQEENSTVNPLYTPHNNAYTYSEEEWMYRNSAETSENTLTPASQVDFVNEFPYPLPSAGGWGMDRYIFFGTMLTVASVLFAAWLWYDRRKRRTMNS